MVADETPMERVRRSCCELMEHACFVKINQDKLASLVNSISSQELENGARPIPLPLKFEKWEDEVNFWTTLNLINFGSGFRHELKKASGKGAYETMLYGMVGLHLSGSRIDAERLQNVTSMDIEALFRIKLREEQETGIPGLKKDAPGPLSPLAQQLRKTLNDAGRILWETGHDDFASFLFKEGDFSCEGIVRRLIGSFSAFDDHSVVPLDQNHHRHHHQSGEAKEREIDVCFYKKAQLTAGDLFKALRPKDDRFAFQDVASLTVFTDNVLPAVLRFLGVVELEHDLEKRIEKGIGLKAGREECELRAAAVVACDQIVQSLKETRGIDVTALDLDYYLWRLGKKEEYRPRERHYTKNTIFY